MEKNRHSDEVQAIELKVCFGANNIMKGLGIFPSPSNDSPETILSLKSVLHEYRSIKNVGAYVSDDNFLCFVDSEDVEYNEYGDAVPFLALPIPESIIDITEVVFSQSGVRWIINTKWDNSNHGIIFELNPLKDSVVPKEFH